MYAFTLVWIAPAWAGVRIMQIGSVAIGLVVVIVSLVTLVLWVRSVCHAPDMSTDGSFDITREGLDYVVWTAIAVPFIFIALILVWLLAGGANGS
jgi:hypothetical protein